MDVLFVDDRPGHRRPPLRGQPQGHRVGGRDQGRHRQQCAKTREARDRPGDQCAPLRKGRRTRPRQHRRRHLSRPSLTRSVSALASTRSSIPQANNALPGQIASGSLTPCALRPLRHWRPLPLRNGMRTPDADPRPHRHRRHPGGPGLPRPPVLARRRQLRPGKSAASSPNALSRAPPRPSASSPSSTRKSAPGMAPSPSPSWPATMTSPPS